MQTFVVLGPLVPIGDVEHIQAVKVFVMDGRLRMCTDLPGDRYYPVNWPVREADVALGMGPPNRMMMIPAGESVRVCDGDGNVVEEVSVEALIDRFCNEGETESA